MNDLLANKVLTGMTFLVIDDEPDNVGVVVKLLNLLGAAVISAENGQEALDRARTAHPDVVLSDLSMPVMSGWEFLYNLRQDAALQHIPVIALTAHAMSGDRERVLEAGFVNYITKPIDVPKFIPQLVGILKDIPQTAAHFAS